MMRSLGYEVFHYGVEGSASGGHNIDILSREEWEELRLQSHRELYPGRDITAQDFVGDLANINTPLYKEFNRRLRAALLEHYRDSDIVCLPLERRTKKPSMAWMSWPWSQA